MHWSIADLRQRFSAQARQRGRCAQCAGKSALPAGNGTCGHQDPVLRQLEIFVGGRPLSFKRSKSKELLAYLVDRNGATCTNGEMLAVLWEDKRHRLAAQPPAQFDL